MALGIKKKSLLRPKARRDRKVPALPSPIQLKTGKVLRTIEDASRLVSDEIFIHPVPLSIEFCRSVIDHAKSTRNSSDLYWAHSQTRYLLISLDLI